MVNFLIRFLYELTFEICLCSIMYISYADFENDTTNSFTVIVCIAVLLVLFASLLFCGSLAIKNGPYVAKCYQKGTLLQSFWSIRPINIQEIEAF